MAMEFEWEEFHESLKQGLKISHGMKFDDPSEIPDLLPSSPAGFALVSEKEAIKATNDKLDMINEKENDLPIMIPLPLNNFSFHVMFKPYSDCFLVQFKASWIVEFVKPDHFCDFFLAVPITTPGYLNSFRISVVNGSETDVKPVTTFNPMFGDVFFIQMDQVAGGAEVVANVGYIMLTSSPVPDCGSFSIPLCFPFYAKIFPVDQKGKGKQRIKKCEIILSLCAKDGKVVGDYSVNYPLKVLTKKEKVVHLSQKSEGFHVEWPGQDLYFNYTLRAEEFRAEEIVESAEPKKKKARVTNQLAVIGGSVRLKEEKQEMGDSTAVSWIRV